MKNKCVKFDNIPVIFHITDTNIDKECRNVYWTQFTLDRLRFQKRINAFEKIFRHTALDKYHELRFQKIRFYKRRKDLENIFNLFPF